MKKRLKAQLQARQDMIDRMTPEEYKIYRHRVKALKDAKALTKERRKAIRDAWGANADVGFTKLTAVDFVPDYAKLSKDAIDALKYKDVGSDDITGYMYGHPKTSMLSAYATKLKDWDKREAPAARATFCDVAYEGPSLTSRGPMQWGAKAIAAQQAAEADAEGDANMANAQQ